MSTPPVFLPALHNEEVIDFTASYPERSAAQNSAEALSDKAVEQTSSQSLATQLSNMPLPANVAGTGVANKRSLHPNERSV